MKRVCQTDGCENAVRRHQTRCDDCIVAEARRRVRERETTQSGIRGGQGRSGREVEQSAAIAGAAIVGCVVLILIAALWQAVEDAVGTAGRAGATVAAESAAAGDE